MTPVRLEPAALRERVKDVTLECQKILSGTLSVSNNLGPEQARLNVGPDLDPKAI